jgi:MoxR-like ATPase
MSDRVMIEIPLKIIEEVNILFQLEEYQKNPDEALKVIRNLRNTATKKIAQQRGITIQSVVEQYTRKHSLNADEFDNLLKDWLVDGNYEIKNFFLRRAKYETEKRLIEGVFNRSKEKENKMSTLNKNVIIDTIQIAKLIYDNDLDDVRLSLSEDALLNRNKYNKQIKPSIDRFVEKYGNTPNIILKNFLQYYLKKNQLEDNYEAQGFHFYGQKVYSYVWGCITKKDTTIKDRKASYYPQLYILINRFGIKFGFCYGDHIKELDPKVIIVINNKNILRDLLIIFETNKNLKMYNKVKVRSMPEKEEILEIDEIKNNWSRDTNLITFYKQNEIPEDIEERIITTFNDLLNIFNQLSLSQEDEENLTQDSNKSYVVIEGEAQERRFYAQYKDTLRCRKLDQDFLITDLFFNEIDKEMIEKQISTTINSGKHIILFGPPGTGKTKLAKNICNFYNGNNYILSTATSDWSTYETIGGYKLQSNNQLNFFPGLFLRCFQNSKREPINNWLIIDEINRADIDKAFGYLFSALSEDNIILPYDRDGKQIEIIGSPHDGLEVSDHLFIIPSDWRIIATMNTFDKSSLYEMSYAFMRRFAFIIIDVPETIDENIVMNYVQNWGFEIDVSVCINISILWTIVNSKRKIGPAIIRDIYQYVKKTQDYVDAILLYVLPQFEGLNEEEQVAFLKDIAGQHFIDNPNKLKRFSSEFLGINKRRLEYK